MSITAIRMANGECLLLEACDEHHRQNYYLPHNWQLLGALLSVPWKVDMSGIEIIAQAIMEERAATRREIRLEVLREIKSIAMAYERRNRWLTASKINFIIAREEEGQ